MSKRHALDDIDPDPKRAKESDEKPPTPWRRIKDRPPDRMEKTQLDIEGACRINASPKNIAFVDGTYVEHGRKRMREERLSELKENNERSACYRYVVWLFKPKLPSESDIRDMYSQIDIFQHGNEYYFFRKPSYADLPKDIQLLFPLDAPNRFKLNGVNSKDYKTKMGGDPREYPKECAAVTFDLADNSFDFGDLMKLEENCGPGRNVQKIVVEGPMAFQFGWKRGSLYIEQFSKLTRTLQMNSIEARHIPDFDLSDSRDSFSIRECGVSLLDGRPWLDFVQRHLRSRRLTISRWVVEVHPFQDDEARFNDIRIFSETIRRISNSPIYLVIYDFNATDVNGIIDQFVDGFIVRTGEMFEHVHGTVKGDIDVRPL